MNSVFISIGSNLGDKIGNCKIAIEEIAAFAKILKVSSCYETEPLGYEEQPNFINCAAEICTDLSPHDLLTKLNKIEDKLGRVRLEEWGPRTIDLDIVFFGNQVINDENLEIPHPRAHLRRFVLEPICEIAPEFIHPEYNLPIYELLKEIKDEKKVIKLN